MGFHNVNGISLQGTDGLDMFLNDLATLDVDVYGFSEHCLDSTKYSVTNKAQEIVRRHSHSPALFCLHSSDEPAIHQYKPGGTGVYLRGPIVGQLDTNGIQGDPMGRWTTVHLKRKHKPPISIITAYQVCPRPTNHLGNTAYHQQMRALSKAGRFAVSPRQAFITDLDAYLEKLQSKGHDIILGGDFNESLEDRNSGLHRLITNRNLTDPFLCRFPTHCPFGTYALGSRRIDLIFLTPSLLQSVIRMGYAPFNYAATSDHRLCLIEFDTACLIGTSGPPHLSSVKNRNVKASDKTIVRKFIKTWFSLLSEQGTFALQRQLDDDNANTDTLELLDAMIGDCGRRAEKKCQKRRPEFYSQALTQQRVTVSILRGHLRSLRQGLDRTTQFATRLQRYGMTISLSPSIQITSQMLSSAVKELREMNQEHESLRQKELDDKIRQAVGTGRKTTEQALKAIQKAEMHRNTYRIIRNLRLRQAPQSKIDRVEIPSSWPPPFTPLSSIRSLEDPKSCNQWRLVTSGPEVEYYIMLRNRLHFGQADGTPFTRTPLAEQLDWGATTEQAQQLLEGNYPGGQVNHPHLEELLRQCKQAAPSDSIAAEISVPEFRAKIRKWRETTTTSPSGRHLGWYKSLFAKGCSEDTPDEESTCSLMTMQETIVALMLSIMNYCIRHTYVLERWKKIVNVMIFKEQGNYQIHRLRVIHIYEADLNLLLAVKWRQTQRLADTMNLLNEGQYGGRPGCEAQSLTLLEELKYDLAYLSRRTLINFDNDATSCYDRIVVPFASVVNRKYGLHRQTVALHAKTLREAKYYLQTANGESDEHYTNCTRYPIHGTGQGSGNSPCIWLLISSTLFDVHRRLSFGASFISPDGTSKSDFSMTGFVDDATGTCNDFNPQHEAPLPQLLNRMQQDAQTWNCLLHCTGGRLELSKCSFHVLHFEYLPNGTPIPSIQSYDNMILLADPDTGLEVPITSKRSFDPHRTLGHFKAPASSQQTAILTLKAKADRVSMMISTSPLTRYGAYLAYHTVYNPSIGYVLPQSYFPESTLDKAQSSSLERIISKSGYNRNSARAFLFAPIHSGGGGFLPWYLLQGEGQILQFIKHWRTESVISNTLKTAISWAQWQSGHPRAILEDVDTPLTYLECRWITSLRTFLSRIQGRLVVECPFVSSPEKTKDVYIMEFARECGIFNDKDLRILNYCRLYLHVTTVSELFDASGTVINSYLYNCQREPWFSTNQIITLQRRPSDHQIRKKWQRLCRQWTTSTGLLGAAYDLGKWQKQGHQLRRRRESYIDTKNSSVLYRWHQDKYWLYTRLREQPRSYQRAHPTKWTPTSSCRPVDIIITGVSNIIDLKAPTRLLQIHHSIIRAHDFMTYVRDLSTWDKFLLEGLTLLEQPHSLIHTLGKLPPQIPLLAVSDGSVKDSQITYGWVFGTGDGKILAQHYGHGDGPKNSYRAEAWGMLSVSRFLYHLYRYTTPDASQHNKDRVLAFVSDNNGLISRVTQRRKYSKVYPNTTLTPDWDVTEQICATIQELPFDAIDVQWVKGHRDDVTDTLTEIEQFNVIADSLAAKAHSLKPLPTHQPICLPIAKCSLFIKETMIQGHYRKFIRDAYSMPEYKEYIATRHGWDSHQKEAVDWEVFQRAVSKSTIPQVQLQKFIHDKLPTKYELAKSNPSQQTQCQHCSSVESFSHLLQCTNPYSATFRKDLVEEIRSDHMNASPKRSMPCPLLWKQRQPVPRKIIGGIIPISCLANVYWE